MSILLYSARGSNSSERVEWVLNYKQIPYQRLEVESAELTTSYLTINPLGYVPALSVEGEVLCESMAIIEYLEEQYDQHPLLGNTPLMRANVRRVCEYVNASIHSPQNRSVLEYLRPELNDLTKRELRGRWISVCLEKLGSTVCLESGFAVGNEFTLADIFIASIYKKALQHGTEKNDFYHQHLCFLRGNRRIADAEPQV